MFALTVIPFYPITALLILNPKTKKWSTAVFLFWSHVLSFLFLIFVKKNKCEIPDEPVVIVANHSSYLDIFMMYQILPFRHLVFMGKSEILNYPLIKTYFKHLHIPVDRSDKRKAAQSMLQAKSKLQEGWSIVIFPEGGIEDGLAPRLAEFKPGAFVLAQKNKVHLLPISLITHYKLLSELENKSGSSRPGIALAHIHPVLEPEAMQQKSIEEFMAITQMKIASMLDVPSF